MAERIDPLPPDAEPYERLAHNERLYDIYLDVVLPTDYQHVTCIKHLAKGRAAELYDIFMLDEVIFPGEEEEPLLRFRWECAGKTALGGCGLRIVQYDRDGNKIG